jgi:hypothetical protein
MLRETCSNLVKALVVVVCVGIAASGCFWGGGRDGRDGRHDDHRDDRHDDHHGDRR